MAGSESKSLSELFLEKTELTCEKEFEYLLEPDSAAKHGDAYAKYVDNALVRLEGMVDYAGYLLEGHAASMTVARIFSTWRNRLHAVRECKENMRVFSRSEKEIATIFREFCGGCAEAAAAISRDDRQADPVLKSSARHRKEGALLVLGELFPMPELYEISDRFPISPGDGGAEEGGNTAGQPEKTFRITVELTEKEACAFSAALHAERKIRTAIEEAGGEPR